mgnify:CR=1 FL=1
MRRKLHLVLRSLVLRVLACSAVLIQLLVCSDAALAGDTGTTNLIPINDAFASAMALEGGDISLEGTLGEATVEPSEPPWQFGSWLQPTASVWFRWKAPADGVIQYSLTSPDAECRFDPFRGPTAGSAESILTGCGGEDPHARVFVVHTGVTYHLRVATSRSSWMRGPQDFRLHLSFFERVLNVSSAAATFIGEGELSYSFASLGGIVGDVYFAERATTTTYLTWKAKTSGFVSLFTTDATEESLDASLLITVSGSSTAIQGLTFMKQVSGTYWAPFAEPPILVEAGETYLIEVKGGTAFPARYRLHIANVASDTLAVESPLPGMVFRDGGIIPIKLREIEGSPALTDVRYFLSPVVPNQYAFHADLVGRSTVSPHVLLLDGVAPGMYRLGVLARNAKGSPITATHELMVVSPHNDLFEEAEQLTIGETKTNGTFWGAQPEWPATPIPQPMQGAVWYRFDPVVSGVHTIQCYLDPPGLASLEVFELDDSAKPLSKGLTDNYDNPLQLSLEVRSGRSYRVAVSGTEPTRFSLTVASGKPPSVQIRQVGDLAPIPVATDAQFEIDVGSRDSEIEAVSVYLTDTVYNRPIPFLTTASRHFTVTIPLGYDFAYHRIGVRARTRNGLESISSKEFETAFVRPENDDFENAAPIPAEGGKLHGWSHAASSQAEEPVLDLGGHTVWYSWKAPRSGQTLVSIDSLLPHGFGVYSGPTLGNLSQIVASESGPSVDPSARAVFMAAQGETYHILAYPQFNPWEFDLSLEQIDPLQVQIVTPPVGFHVAFGQPVQCRAAVSPGASPVSRVEFYAAGSLIQIVRAPDEPIFWFTNSFGGEFNLQVLAVAEDGAKAWSQPVLIHTDPVELPRPPNDTFANASLMESIPAFGRGTTLFADRTGIEPWPGVWHRWMAPSMGEVTFEVWRDHHYQDFIIYAGTDESSVIEVTRSRSPVNNSVPFIGLATASFTAQAGQSYHVFVGSNGGEYEIAVRKGHPPTIQMISRLPSSIYSTNFGVLYSASGSNAPVETVELFLDDKKVGRRTAPPYEFEVSVKHLRMDRHSLQAIVTDELGNKSSSVSAFNLRLPFATNDKVQTAKALEGEFNWILQPGFEGSSWWRWTAPRSGRCVFRILDGAYKPYRLAAYGSEGPPYLIKTEEFLDFREGVGLWMPVIEGTTYLFHSQLAGEGPGRVFQAQLFLIEPGIPAIPRLRLSSDQLELRLDGQLGDLFQLQFSSDLQSWLPVATSYYSIGQPKPASLLFDETLPRRFFRAVSVP